MAYYPLPPKRAFCHTISYLVKTGEDDWGKPITDTVEIKHCWFNRATQFTRSGNNSSEMAPNASITMTNRYSGKIPVFKVEDTVTFDGEDYTIVMSKPLIINGQEIGWRLEVK